MPEVIKNTEELLFINNELVEQIIKEAKQSKRHIARMLMHFDHADPVQEMLIAIFQLQGSKKNVFPIRRI